MSYILLEDGTQMLMEDGTFILMQDDTSGAADPVRFPQDSVSATAVTLASVTSTGQTPGSSGTTGLPSSVTGAQ